MESGYNISNRKRFAKITGGSMNNSMKKNIRHFFLLTALAAGTIHLVNRFIDMTAEMKNILKTESGSYYHWKNGSIFLYQARLRFSAPSHSRIKSDLFFL